MTENKLTIVVNRLIEEVFDYTLNPKNSHNWIDFIEEETSSDWPPKTGSVDRNRRMGSQRWASYKLSALVKNKTVTLSSLEGDYGVRYTFKPIGNKATEFEYYEWTKSNNLDSPFTLEQLEKL